MDAVTGRLSGAVREDGLCSYQSHIKGSAGKDGVMIVGLDGTVSPGVCSVLLPLSLSGTTTFRLRSQDHHPPE